MQTAMEQAANKQWYIVLKNQYTLCVTPQRQVWFNTTGNPAMATGGMGDVLTGTIVALLAQGYSPQQASIMGVWLHGYAANQLALPQQRYVVLPSQVARQLPLTMAQLINLK